MDKPQLPKMLKKLYLFLLLLCSLTGFEGYTQTFPISVNTQITQPSPIYLSKYADATTINSPIKIQLVLNDLTISNRQVRLKIYFQGNGVSFSNNDFVVGAKPLYLEGGFPLQLTNVDLAPYFQYQNLLGLNPNQYAQPLPEGISNFYVEVYDFATGKKLSRKTGTTTVIFQNEPPFLNLPLNNASIMQQNIQNIVFSWTPRSINVSNVEYEFSLVEIWDNYTPVQNAFAYSPPLYTTTTKMTTLQYGMSEPQLIPGKKYAWRIKAKAILGAEEIGVFKNNGYTEIFAFTYEVFCTSPLAVKTESIGQDQAKISWSGNIDNFDYRVNYREKNSGSQWYKAVTPRENITLSNLKPNTTYEYTVGASCDIGKYINSSIFEFTTIARDEIVFQGCGIKPDPRDLANQTPLPELFPNDVITAGDFPVVVLKAIGSNGNFSGEGYVTLPFLEKFRKLIDAADALGAKDENGASKGNLSENTRIRITFNNVGVNSDFKLISGEIIAAYDPTWSGISDLDGVINDAFGDAGNVVNQDIQFPIKSVVKNPDGSITITGPDDVKVNLPKTVNDIIITDKNGKQYAVPANAPAGNIEKTGQLAPGGIPNSKNTNGMGSGGSVTEISSPDVNVIFSKGNGFYAFDHAPAAANGSLGKTYETIPQKSGGTYNVNLKAISNSPNKTDIVIATANFKNGKTKKDIVFKTQNGTAIDSTQIVWNDNVATLTLKKTLDFAKETVIATVKPATSKDPKETVGKYDIAGTIDLWHLTNKKVNVTLVSVNNASIPANAKEQLNAIYEPAGVTFDVNTLNVTLDNSWGESIETSDSDLLNTYTPDQQQITNNLKAKLGADYKKDTYYIIYTGAPSDKSNILGFMPLKRQYGFIFNKTNTVRTLAHELGHGVFGLKHPFTEYNTATTTDLLMDYGTGVLLSHNDWQVLHTPGLQLYPFIQGNSDGEYRMNELISGITLDDLSSFNENEVPFLTKTGEVLKLKKEDFKDISFNQNGTIFAFTKIELLKGERYLSAVQKKDSKIFSGFSSDVEKDDDFFKFSYDSKNFDYVYIVQKSENNPCTIKVEKISLKKYAEYNYIEKSEVSLSSLIVKSISTNEVASVSSCKKKNLFTLIDNSIKDPNNQTKIAPVHCEEVLNHLGRYFTPDELEKYSVDEKLKIIEFFKEKDCPLKDNYFSKVPGERYFASCFKNVKESDQELFLQSLLTKNVINFIFDEVDTKWLLTGGENNFHEILSVLSLYTTNLNKNKGYKEDQLTLNFDSSINPFKDAFRIDIEKDKIKFDTSISSTYLLLFDNKPVYLGIYDVVLVNFKVPFVYKDVTFEGIRPIPALFFVVIANEVANQANIAGANVVVDVVSVLSGAELAVQMYKQTAKTFLKSPKFWRHVTGVVLGSANVTVNTVLIDKLQGTEFLAYWNTINLVYGITDIGFNINDFIKARNAAKVKLVNETSEINTEFDNLADGLEKKFEPVPDSNNNVVWLLWSQYPKKVINGEEFAIVGNRYFSQIAVESMIPSGGGGSGFTANVIEGILSNGEKVTIDGKSYCLTIDGFINTENNESIIRSISKISERAAEKSSMKLTNAFVGTKLEKEAAKATIKEFRSSTGDVGGNYGYLSGTVNGEDLNNRLWRSGAALKEEPQIFKAIEAGKENEKYLRNTDSEYKMLNALAFKLKGVPDQQYPNIKGQIKIVSELDFCSSCRGVIKQFNDMFPGIKLIIINGAR
ncbi:deaminase domain-containing protein [Flavobacterium collinsii]|uniref:Fibronectin type-III domain-containing protein n=1 Tax=Flavobacterium collinsii TaxID=1114861 RepID=A0A9W4X6V8_9FLAO|nr:deaminase domain-containing protein [Flavobacterium collinsii]CAI2767618.1 protein of unknown function [Flavobacterium collinsii]